MNNVPKLTFTGERMIPDENRTATFYYEHINRYLFASQFVKDKIVLDLASGSGYGSDILIKHGYAEHVYGIDLSQDAIEYAKQRYHNKKCTFTVDNALLLNTIPPHSIDVIICFELIEHINEQNTLLKAIKKVMKKDGICIISTPNTENYQKDNEFHVKELTITEFSRLMERYFSFVTLYSQRYTLTQTIERLYPQNLVKLDKLSYEVQQSNEYKLCNEQTIPEYFLAICSNKNIPTITNQKLHVHKVDNIDFSGGAHLFSMHLSNVYTSLQNQDCEELRNAHIDLTKKYKELEIRYNKSFIARLISLIRKLKGIFT